MVLKRLRLRFGCCATRSVRLPIARAPVRTTAVSTSAATPISVRACSVLCKIDVTVFAKTIIYLFLAEKKNRPRGSFFIPESKVLPRGGVRRSRRGVTPTTASGPPPQWGGTNVVPRVRKVLPQGGEPRPRRERDGFSPHSGTRPTLPVASRHPAPGGELCSVLNFPKGQLKVLYIKFCGLTSIFIRTLAGCFTLLIHALTIGCKFARALPDTKNRIRYQFRI